MSFREQLHAYISQLEQRLRWNTLLRGLAILTGSALVATLVLVAIANAIAFSPGSVTAARFGLILILTIAAAAGLALPLRRLTRRRAIGTAETAFPQFQQRLTTFAERDGQPLPRHPARRFVALLSFVHWKPVGQTVAFRGLNDTPTDDPREF
jgi:hypothetical protein